MQILVDRLLNDILWQRPVIVRIRFQPVAGKLLVERRLSVSGLISVGRPEPGTVRSQHLVADDKIPLLVQAELKLGVCDNDAAGQGVIRAFLIEGKRTVAKLRGIFFTLSRKILFQMSNALFIRNILVVVADLGFCRRRIDRLDRKSVV